MASSISMCSVRSWLMKTKLSPRRCSTFWSDPVSRLSMLMTRKPRPISASQRWEPRNPAPPVTTAVGIGRRCYRPVWRTPPILTAPLQRAVVAVSSNARPVSVRHVGRALEHTAAVPFVELGGSFHGPFKERLLSAFGELLEDGTFINGPPVAEFERAFASFVGARFCVGTGSGLDALRL